MKGKHLRSRSSTGYQTPLVTRGRGGQTTNGVRFEVIMQPGEDFEIGNQIAENLEEVSELLGGSYFGILNAKPT